ncbi:MAG: XRE family transcriptional regulator [Alphaproteobacteria bacterium]|nr:MAG: XRE family transcriptional regulator [Alphaproteobacteria bacterium]
MIDAKQIRAARALLNWSREELAEQTGISVPALARAETGESQLRTTSAEKIKSSLEQAGVIFTDGSGVKLKTDLVQIYEGENCYLKLLEDFEDLNVKGEKEILFSSASEKRSTDEVIEKTRLLRKKGIKMRFLLEEGDTYIMGDLSEYRWMHKSLFSKGDVKLVYADKVAYLVSWMETPRVVVVSEKNIAEENRRAFEFIWNISKKPTHSDADISY